MNVVELWLKMRPFLTGTLFEQMRAIWASFLQFIPNGQNELFSVWQKYDRDSCKQYVAEA